MARTRNHIVWGAPRPTLPHYAGGRTLKAALAVSLVWALFAGAAAGQRIDADGGNEMTIGIGPTDTEVTRSVRGSLDVGVGEDGVSLDAGGSVGIGIGDHDRTLGGGISLGGSDKADAAEPARASSNGTPAISNTSKTSTDAGADADICVVGNEAQLALILDRWTSGADIDPGAIEVVPVVLCETGLHALMATHGETIASVRGEIAASPGFAQSLSERQMATDDVIAMQSLSDGQMTVYTIDRLALR